MKSKYCEFAGGTCPNGINLLGEEHKIFTAYSSHQEEIVKIIENGIAELNENTDIRWNTWKNDIDIENQMIFCEICKNICSSKAVLLELSDLNFNVIFEYGYSLSFDKKIHPTVNYDFDFDDIDRFIKPLLGIGIGKYEKNKFSQKLIKKRFWDKDKMNTLLRFDTEDVLDDKTDMLCNTLIYIKNIDRPEISDVIEGELIQNDINYIIDDSVEEYNSIVWYYKQIKNAYGAIIDLGMSSKRDNLNHYLKCAFIAGLCVGSGRRTLVINSTHAKKPSDIILLVKSYPNAKEAKKIVAKYLSLHSNTLAMINSNIHDSHSNITSRFVGINLGEHVAENDSQYLQNAFIYTPEYYELSSPGYKLIIGRKGTGKSAAFQKYKMDQHHNAFSISRLFNQYNLDDIYNLTIKFEQPNDKNKIIIAFWKYVLYTIIISDLYTNITNKEKLKKDLETCDIELKQYYEKCYLHRQDTSITENLVEIITSITGSQVVDVSKIQKYFYDNEILDLMRWLTQYFQKYDKSININIDGLDSNLSMRNNPEVISLIIFNLHEVCQNLFCGNLQGLTINLFIREDIYDSFKNLISQKDKVKKIIYRWKPENLLMLIKKRLQENGINNIADILLEDFNSKRLCDKLNQYVYQRPRDYIFIFNHLIQIAKCEKVDHISNKIFVEALDYYSSHVYESIEAELLSINTKMKMGEFLSDIKHLNNENDKIPIEIMETILEKYTNDSNKTKIIIEFLLRIEFMYYLENNNPVKWNSLIDSQTKLSIIFSNSRERKQFFLHPIIKFLLEKHF